MACFVAALLLLAFLPPYSQSHGGLRIPGLPSRFLAKFGDINLGIILPITSPCNGPMRVTSILQYIEVIVYSVETVNSDPDLLPNVTLGYVILDDCYEPFMSLAQALSFVPRVGDGQCSCDDINATCDVKNVTGDAQPWYDVVGAIASLQSPNSIEAAAILGTAEVPQISFMSTSDALSDKDKFPYFLRVVPANKDQIDAMFSLVLEHDWRYVSMVYSDDSYGESALQHLRDLTRGSSVCVAVAARCQADFTSEEFDLIANQLLSHRNARVVILFTGSAQVRGVLQAVQRQDPGRRRFIWLGSDGWATSFHDQDYFTELVYGALTFTFYSKPSLAFTQHFTTLHPSNTTHNPWFAEGWEIHFGCSLNDSAPDHCADDLEFIPDVNFTPSRAVTAGTDAVYAYAHALHALLRDRCPEARGREARRCVQAPELLRQLMQVDFQGQSGRMHFDESGNAAATFHIEQVLPRKNGPRGLHHRPVALVDSETSQITWLAKITWEHVEPGLADTVPESVCSHECPAGSFKLIRQTTCCWSCTACRENEILVANSSDCQPCPLFTWPDPASNLTSCAAIPPTSLRLSDPVPAFLLALAAVGLLATAAILTLYVRHRHARAIKASSRELGCLMLGGVLGGYCTVAVLLLPPSRPACAAGWFCFGLSFSALYAPLLTRAVRILRIFRSGASAHLRPRFISPKSQILIAGSLIAGQVVLSTALLILYDPEPRLEMPSVTANYVELTCDFPLEVISAFLAYNLALVVSCSVVAFKARKLPDAFNETRFISMCVYTTLVLWLAFVPAYFTSARHYLRTVLLAAAVLLNESVALAFLFLPKIYAALHLEQGQGSPDPNDVTAFVVSKIGQSIVHRAPNFVRVAPLGTGGSIEASPAEQT